MKFYCDTSIAIALDKVGLEKPEDADIGYIYESIKYPGKLGYLTQNRLDRVLEETEYVVDDIYWIDHWHCCKIEIIKKHAYVGRPARVLRKILPDLDNTKIQEFALLFTAEEGNLTLREDVTEVYAKTEVDSCMCGYDMSFYEQNGVKVLTLEIGGSCEGRALVWENIDADGVFATYMDKVYVRNYNNKELFIKHADKNGWIRKEEVTVSGVSKRTSDAKLTYKLCKSYVDFYPYCDTMKYFDRSNGLIGTNLSGTTMDMTDGEFEENDGMIWSEYHEDYINEDNAVYSEYHGTHLNIEEAVETRTGDWFHTDDIDETIVEIDSSYYLREEACLINGNWHLEEDCIQDIDGEWWPQCSVDTDIVEVGGNYYQIDDSRIYYDEVNVEYKLETTRELIEE